MVEQPSDVIPIERSGKFHGRYHVLGGRCRRSTGWIPSSSTSPSCSNGPPGNGMREVVIATNATTTGEATALYLADSLRERRPRSRSPGWPAAAVGSDLEYADEITLGRALQGRQAL